MTSVDKVSDHSMTCMLSKLTYIHGIPCSNVRLDTKSALGIETNFANAKRSVSDDPNIEKFG